MARKIRKSRAKKRQDEALFRYQVISRVRALELGGAVRAEAVGEVAGGEHFASAGVLRKVSTRTLYRWLAAYNEGGSFESLEPAARERTGTSIVLPDAFIDFIREEKRLDPRASAPELIRRAEICKVVEPSPAISRSTVWRACKRMGLPTRRRPQKREGDMRRFAYPHRMMMTLCDGKHFRAGATRKRRVALFFIDDATRYGLHAVVGTSENTDLFLGGFHDLVIKRGYMNVIYMDHGAGFTSDDTKAVVASMPHVYLINGKKAYPEGRGKVERFNQTAIGAVLRSLDGAAEVDPDCAALTLRLRHFLFDQYNNRPHESLGLKTPNECWSADERPLRFPESVAKLREHFVVTEARKVSKDHIIKYGGELYEAPRGLGGEWIDVRRGVLTGEISVLHYGRLVRLHPVDLAANAKTQRAHARIDNDEPVPGDAVPKTAATMAFERDFAPLVGPDGGFTDNE
jgi:transposase InsO family protein